MLRKYKLYSRRQGGHFYGYYAEEIGTGRRKSLQTKTRWEADELLSAKNEGARAPQLAKSKAKHLLTEADEKLLTRTWQHVMNHLVFNDVNIKPPTRERKERAYQSRTFDKIRTKPLYETKAEDLMMIVSVGQISKSNYLKQLQNHAIGMGWLESPLLPKKLFMKERRDADARAITHEEHRRIVSSEGNGERRRFYEMLWLTGASQTDGANLKADNFCLREDILRYSRVKNGKSCGLKFGEPMIRLLRELPSKGYLFPRLRLQDQRARGAEFKRRCRILAIPGISTKSYRYAWAERAYEQGISEREAMAALGHGTKAVHRAYAKGAQPVCGELSDVA